MVESCVELASGGVIGCGDVDFRKLAIPLLAGSAGGSVEVEARVFGCHIEAGVVDADG